MEKVECKKLKCPMCDKYFGKKSNLKAHILLKHKEVNEYDLVKVLKDLRPERVELELKPFRCDVCSKQFIRKANLRNHMKIHIGKEKVECVYCGRTMDQKNLKRHHKLRQETCLKSSSASNKIGKGQNTMPKTAPKNGKSKPFASFKTTSTSNDKQTGQKEKRCEKENDAKSERLKQISCVEQTDQYPLPSAENSQKSIEDKSTTGNLSSVPHSDGYVRDSKNCDSGSVRIAEILREICDELNNFKGMVLSLNGI